MVAKQITPSLIDRIQDRNGATIYRHDSRPCEGCQFSLDGMTSQFLNCRISVRSDNASLCLSDGSQCSRALSNAALGGALPSWTLPLLAKPEQPTTTPMAGLSATPDLAVGVFVGYDTPRPLGKRETGSTVAVPIFGDFIAAPTLTGR